MTQLGVWCSLFKYFIGQLGRVEYACIHGILISCICNRIKDTETTKCRKEQKQKYWSVSSFSTWFEQLIGYYTRKRNHAGRRLEHDLHVQSSLIDLRKWVQKFLNYYPRYWFRDYQKKAMHEIIRSTCSEVVMLVIICTYVPLFGFRFEHESGFPASGACRWSIPIAYALHLWSYSARLEAGHMVSGCPNWMCLMGVLGSQELDYPQASCSTIVLLGQEKTLCVPKQCGLYWHPSYLTHTTADRWSWSKRDCIFIREICIWSTTTLYSILSF